MDVDMRGQEEEASPVGPKMPATLDIRRTLLSAVEDLSNHGLKLSAKWAAEQLVGLPSEPLDEQQAGAGAGSDQPVGRQPTDLWLEGRVVFAKALMDVGEFERASKAFGDSLPRIAGGGGADRAGDSLSSRARFIRWYSLYLAGERRREEESQLTDALQRRRLINPHLPTLHAELSACDAEGTLDAFGLFIYGAVLKAMRGEGRGQGSSDRVLRQGQHQQQQHRQQSTTAHTPSSAFRTPTASYNTPDRSWKGAGKGSPAAGVAAPTRGGGGGGGVCAGPVLGSTTAQDVLERSLRLFPYNWSAWLDLATLCLETDTVPEGLEADPPCPWMYQFFLQHLLVEQHRCKDALAVLDYLHPSFPGSSYLLGQTAVAHYHLRNFDQGHSDFKELRRRDPLRMEGLDVFSNILYVKECKAELSFLAHTTVKTSPLRPETNCIVGNYYSLKGQHEKAVTYFLKALRLDRRCLSAWTLMGHEFVELKNSGAAIESYRQAVDINPKDYRAWYGLGQAYEILQMHLYAIYYYRRATALRPYDARMWIAMGNCLEKLEKYSEAISTYERAMVNDDREGVALERLAKLYSADGRKEEAARCYENMLTNRCGEGDTSSAKDAMLYLCYHYKKKGNYARTSSLANGLLDYPGTSREEALAVLREIRSIIETRRQQTSVSSSFVREMARQSASDTPSGRPLFTPQTGYRGIRGSGDTGMSSMSGLSGGTPASGLRGDSRAGTVSSSRGRERLSTSGATMRGAGAVSPAGGGYRLSMNNTPSFLSRSSVDMSVAMSLGSDDESGAADATAASTRGGTGAVTDESGDARP